MVAEGIGAPPTTRSDTLLNRLQGGDEVAEKAGGIAIPCVQRQPGRRQLALGQPIADQHGLPKPGWCRDQRQPVVEPFIQPLDQPGTNDGPGLALRNI